MTNAVRFFSTRASAAILAAAVLGACASPRFHEAQPPNLGTLWVRNAAEYRALSTQAYAAATGDLQRLIADKSFSALPQQAAGDGYADKPPAIVFDVDETLVDNVEFQLQLEGAFTDDKFDAWLSSHTSPAVPGAAAFARRARDAGVELFFVTNRRCRPIGDSDDPCPQEHVALEDLHDAGIPADAGHVLLSGETPAWTQEKEVRRELIARKHRVIMLVGDDLGDFLPCVRKRVTPPCTEPATQESRKAQIEKHAAYWGNGWYVLPNPMYGSWTTTLSGMH